MINTSKPVLPAWHFVVSAPRSGSTWLARALNHHPDILATENRLFGMFCEIWRNPNGKHLPRITVDQFVDCFSRHSFFEELGYQSSGAMAVDFQSKFMDFLGDFLRNRTGKPVIVDKITPYLGTAEQVVRQAKAHSTDQKIIHLVRDGRDVTVSGVFDWIARENQSSDRHKLFVDHDPGVRLKRFFDNELLERWAKYWSETNVAFEKQAPESTLEVRYESMIADQANVLSSIFEYLLGHQDMVLAKKCAAAVTFEKTTGRTVGREQPLSKARKGIAGDWKNYFTLADARLFQELTGDLLQKLAYEPDYSWVENCPPELDLRFG